MNKPITIILVSVICFIVITLITSKEFSSGDGNDFYGYPIIFYTYLGGKRIPEPETRHLLNYGFLVLDIMVAFILTLSIQILFKKLFLKRNDE